jgi:hypothetical protein
VTDPRRITDDELKAFRAWAAWDFADDGPMDVIDAACGAIAALEAIVARNRQENHVD